MSSVMLRIKFHPVWCSQIEMTSKIVLSGKFFSLNKSGCYCFREYFFIISLTLFIWIGDNNANIVTLINNIF